MSDSLRNLTRKQLGQFLPDPRAVRAFEQMLKQLADLIPADLENLSESTQAAATAAAAAQLTANNAQTTANAAQTAAAAAQTAAVNALTAANNAQSTAATALAAALNHPRVEAYDTSTSIALTGTPALLLPALFANSQGITYSPTTGVFTFQYAGGYSLSLSVNATASASSQFVYIYAENSFDNGATWTVNTNSGKFYELTNANTVQIVYSQSVTRVAGQQVRYWIYSNSNKVTLGAQTLPGGSGAIVPAIRVQYVG